MPQNRQNADRTLTPAEKQARHRQKKEAEGDRLRGLLFAMERAIWEAADRGNALAGSVKGSSVESIVENLTAHFEAAGRAGRE